MTRQPPSGGGFTIGIDVGGTFTDIVVSVPGGNTIIAKAATTPADQSDGVHGGNRTGCRTVAPDDRGDCCAIPPASCTAPRSPPMRCWRASMPGLAC